MRTEPERDISTVESPWYLPRLPQVLKLYPPVLLSVPFHVAAFASVLVMHGNGKGFRMFFWATVSSLVRMQNYSRRKSTLSN